MLYCIAKGSTYDNVAFLRGGGVMFCEVASE